MNLEDQWVVAVYTGAIPNKEKNENGIEIIRDYDGGTSANVFITFYWHTFEREKAEVCYKSSQPIALDQPIKEHIINAFQAGSIDKFQVCSHKFQVCSRLKMDLFFL